MDLDEQDIDELIRLVSEEFAAEMVGMMAAKHPTTRMVYLNKLEAKLIHLKGRAQALEQRGEGI